MDEKEEIRNEKKPCVASFPSLSFSENEKEKRMFDRFDFRVCVCKARNLLVTCLFVSAAAPGFNESERNIEKPLENEERERERKKQQQTQQQQQRKNLWRAVYFRNVLGSAQRTHARERENLGMFWSVCDRIGPSTSILYGSVSWRLCQMK